MNAKAISLALVAVLISLSAVSAQVPQLLPPVFRTVGAKDTKEKLPEKIKQKPIEKKEEKKLTEPGPAPVDFFAQGPSPYGEVRSRFNPQMLGDQFGRFARQSFTILGTQSVSTSTFLPPSGPTITTGPTSTPITQTRTILVPIPTAGAFKVAENASPRPQDRVFGTYNYYSNIRTPENGSMSPTVLTTGPTSVTVGNTTTTTSSQIVIPGTPYAHLHRETFGFEKTFLDGRASIEVRVPFLQQQSDLDAFAMNHVGDLTIVGRYAFLLDSVTNDVFSAGLAVTAPTGPAIVTTEGTVRSTLLQPWFGYIWNFDRFYIQGFHSVVLPTDSRDVTVLFNDVGLNWWLYYREQPTGLVSFIVPTIETHVTTPLNHRGGTDPIVMYDQVVMTAGVHFGLFRSSTLTLGAATPVTGPRLFDVEAFVQYNRRF